MKIKRIYDDQEEKDNIRILIDRVWPRGISKEKANLDDWLKEIGPSTELRKWFNHDPERFSEFKKRYRKELDQDHEKREAFEQLKKYNEENNGDITILYGAKDTKYNHAVIVKELIEKNK
ncbi:DUF488 domain-containing protein [Gracilibacillus marinus]|jgi:uncharacterized protein YeaO (DUF488 family)|uniref:DUF488 domain-containing protein n=1 Tax=Gracilibacillus marinus TaxID=630535 RepID=A0ABV8VYS0_9BACI